MSDSRDFTFSSKWVSLVGKSNCKYTYPLPVREYLPGGKDGPGVYRWSFFRGGEPTFSPYQVLIGQSESLLRRLSEYVRPTTKEEENWKTLFHKEMESGSIIECHLLEFDDFSVNGVRVSSSKLAYPFIRTFFESLMLILASKEENCRVLNKGRSVHEKRVERLEKEVKRLEADLTRSDLPGRRNQ